MAIKPVGLDHIVLRTADAARMERFYCEVLGCTVERRRPDLGLIHLRAGRALIDLVTLDGPLGRKGGKGPEAEGRNLDHLCIRIDPFDAEAIVTHLFSSGVDAGEIANRFGADGHGPSMYVRDPDGNTVELKGPPEEG
ncbi:MAG: VOC family protein [Alphaproteobacteria bacterium]|nr:VOC family protein [Alphaproteobacteria bacterium]